ncbi:MAG TPA: hypothetical protein VNJ03_16950 [Vicinamibacterales bacterium]|nr:hypothetical protein [Vicinamibacterales bacterium]
MFRAPFVWEIQIRRELIEEELGKLRELPYSLWHEMLGRSVRKGATARDSRLYRIRTTADWAHQGSENIRVTVALESGAFRRRLLSQSFVITPDNHFKD